MSSSKFTPCLVECENGKQPWADVTANHNQVIIPTPPITRLCLHLLSHTGVNGGMAPAKHAYTGGMMSGRKLGPTEWTRSYEAYRQHGLRAA